MIISNNNFFYCKRGSTSWSLQQLGEIIIGVVVLFLFFKYFIIPFLNIPTNLDIAESDSESIKDFIEFSLDRYDTNNECYTMLKLKNLENFQLEKENNNYFYIIGYKNGQLGVYVVLYDYLDAFIEERSLNNLPTKYVAKLDNNIKLKLDDTSNKQFSFNVYFWKVGRLETKLDLNKEINYILLIPKFNRDILWIEIDSLDSNQNILLGENLYEDKKEDSEGFNLGFNPNSKELFLSKSEFSNMLIKYNLCSMKNKEFNSYTDYLNSNPDKADFINDEIIFDYKLNTNEYKNFQFIWRVDGIKCPTSEDKSCVDYLGNDYDSLSYNDFLKKLVKIYTNVYLKDFEAGQYNIRDVNSLSLNEIYLSNEKISSLFYNYDDLFLKYEVEGLDISKVSNMKKGDVENILKKEFDDKLLYGFSDYRTDKCNNILCDYLGFKNSKIYFYDDTIKSFVIFNHKYLISDDNKNIYFRGKKIDILEEDFDDVGLSFFRGNFDFDFLNLEVLKGKNMIIPIGEYQLNNVYDRRFANE